jgi:hypothetical protein
MRERYEKGKPETTVARRGMKLNLDGAVILSEIMRTWGAASLAPTRNPNGAKKKRTA